MFEKEQLTSILNDRDTFQLIQNNYKPFGGVFIPPKSGLKGWQIAAITVGFAVFVVGLANVIFFLNRRKYGQGDF